MNRKRLICMFGAGGNRPKVRRYEMGEMSGRLADLSVLTADNSRFENVLDIIEDIKTESIRQLGNTLRSLTGERRSAGVWNMRRTVISSFWQGKGMRIIRKLRG